MKSALLLEYDAAARTQTASSLQTLGYVVACAETPRAALMTAQALRFDALLTCTDKNTDDRRSLVGELARLAPGASIVLMLDDVPDHDMADIGHHQDGSTLLFKPVSVKALRRVLDFGVDGAGMHPVAATPSCERRRLGQRRLRPR